MSNLVPSVLTLDKGLNLQTAKIVAPAGSILNSLNYEQVDFQGQKRIDGYTRYDGSLLPVDDCYAVTVLSSPSWEPGDLITTVDGIDGLIGIVVGAIPESGWRLAIINYNLLPQVGDDIYRLVDGVVETPNEVSEAGWAVDGELTPDEHYEEILEHAAVLRDRVETLPGGTIGLHWFRDRLYAVADVATIFLEDESPQIFPGDLLELDGEEAFVLDSFVGDNVRIVFLDTLDTDTWYGVGEEVLRDSGPVGTTAGASGSVEADLVASFFESRTEQQTLDEDGPTGPFNFGWRFKHLGWLVNYEDGLSLFGSLPSLNQNIQGIGVQGPTSTAGNNGRPLTLTQKVSISGRPAQVNGWKSTQTPTSYLLDPDNLTDVDSDYIYADAFFSWDGSTGEVAAPGLTTATLPEYAATATVEITL